MSPSRLLLSGRLATLVAGGLKEALPQVETRVRESPEAGDFEWADSYSGFRWPDTTRPAAFKWVHGMGAGVDGFLEHMDSIGVLTRTVGRMPERMGLFVLAVLLAEAHHLIDFAEAQARRGWRPIEPASMPERCVVLGTGAIAAGIARVLGIHGVVVTGVNRSGTFEDGFGEVRAWEEAGDALEKCQALVVALPMTPATQGLVDKSVLARLSAAQLINVGRGSTLDLDALAEAMRDGAVCKAHLDVFPVEPLEPSSWLWEHPRVRLTPHIAAMTTPSDVIESLVQVHEDLVMGVPPRLLIRPSQLA